MPKTTASTKTFLADLAGGVDAACPPLRRDLMLPVSGEFAILPEFTGEFWTAKQRDAHSLHEISYRACFKPQLPRFFMERLTSTRATVYDPFAGRGTTLVEAALMGRRPLGCDINPLSRALVLPRLDPPRIEAIARRLDEYDLEARHKTPDDLLVFYHPETLRRLVALRQIFLERERAGLFDQIDGWIRMVALNRLTGHSPGFFSVYTLPPNQAVSVQSQRRINKRLDQRPEPRDVRKIILKKSRALLKDVTAVERRLLARARPFVNLHTAPADRTTMIKDASVDLVVTSPPFLDVVDYATDNWLRCWFAGIDSKTVAVTASRRLGDWVEAMEKVFVELHRILRRNRFIAFEVGEVRHGKLKLEESVVPAGARAGLIPVAVLINAQVFTKTSQCWGVENQAKGTNTNRIVVFRKSD